MKYVMELVKYFAGESGLFTTLKVNDLLFGYNDPLLKFLKESIEKIPLIDKYADMINPFFQLEVRILVECV